MYETSALFRSAVARRALKGPLVSAPSLPAPVVGHRDGLRAAPGERQKRVAARGQKRGEGDLNLPVRFHNVSFRPGQYLYADENGVVVAEQRLAVDFG